VKGIGRIYQQTFIDTYSRFGIVKLYTDKTAISAADILNDRVIPFFDKEAIKLHRILTDRGTEYCGKPQEHAYQLYLGIEDIDHSKTKVRHPQTNGICERFHRTMQDECYNILFRKKLYNKLEELQTDVDEWIRKYNYERPHSGKYCYGKTPYQTFLESKHIAIEKTIDENNKKDYFPNSGEKEILDSLNC
jgi:transposase InsO family protein